MNMTIVSDSFIIKESITNILKRIHENIKLLVISNIDNLKDSSANDILFVHIGNNKYEDLNKVLKLK